MCCIGNACIVCSAVKFYGRRCFVGENRSHTVYHLLSQIVGEIGLFVFVIRCGAGFKRQRVIGLYLQLLCTDVILQKMGRRQRMYIGIEIRCGGKRVSRGEVVADSFGIQCAALREHGI